MEKGGVLRRLVFLDIFVNSSCGLLSEFGYDLFVRDFIV